MDISRETHNVTTKPNCYLTNMLVQYVIDSFQKGSGQTGLSKKCRGFQ